MKLKGVIMAAVILLFTSLVTAESNPWSRKLPFEQAVITYEISGMESGSEVLYIKDFGRTTARHRQTSIKMLGVIQARSSVEITTADWIYSFDLHDKAGSKSVNPRKLMVEEYNKLSEADQKKVSDNAQKMANVFTEGMQGRVEQNAKEILGYSCDRISAMGSTIYSIHGTGINLLSVTDLMGVKMKSVATSINKKGVDDKYFEFPPGITLKHDREADEMAQMMAQQTISALRDPEGVKSKGQGFMGIESVEQPAIPEEDQMEMEEAMKTIKGLLGN